MKAAVQKGGVEVVGVNDPFLTVEYMVRLVYHVCTKVLCVSFLSPLLLNM